jgi:Lon protease-like protein
MGWFGISPGISPSSDRSTAERLQIPIFPLNTVLFPGSVLPLRIFEQRYLDMAAACMREKTPFGVCLIDSGEETGSAAVPHEIGTLAEIDTWDMEQLGILQITARGGRRFRILEKQLAGNQLLEALVEIIPNDGGLAVPPESQRLLPLLLKILKELGPERAPEPHFPEDAEWVSFRISEILPVHHLAKQKLLELEDPLMRLEILEKFLEQRQLLG